MDFVGASKLYEEAVQNAPGQVKYLAALAQIELMTGQFQSAETALFSIAKTQADLRGTDRADLAETKEQLGRLYWMMSNFEKSVAEFNVSVMAPPHCDGALAYDPLTSR
jgi:tetratricopeptide (TPR) repeat protein